MPDDKDSGIDEGRLPEKLTGQVSRRGFLTGAAVAVVAGISLPEFLAACATGNAPESKAGVGGTLHVAGFEEMQDVDPHKSRIENLENWGSAAFEGIFGFDAGGKMVPNLASSLDVSADLLTYTFKLQPNAKFHNGRQVTSADIKWNYDRIRTPSTGSLVSGLLSPIKSITTPDDQTVVFTMSSPNADFLYYLVWPTRTGVLAKESVDAKNVVQQPIGTGPYKFVSYTNGGSYVLERNPDYWGTPALIQTVNYKYLPDATSRLAALQSGQMEQAWWVQKDTAEALAKKGNFHVHTFNDNQGSLWAFNIKRPNVSNVVVRQAMELAISRNDIVKAGYDGAGIPQDQPYNPKSVWYQNRKARLDADLAGAKAKLSSSGVNIADMTIKILQYQSFTLKEAQVVQSAWKQLGFKDVTIDTIDSTLIIERLGKGDWDAVLANASGVFVPDRVYNYYDPAQGWRNALAGNINDPRVLSLLVKARSTTDIAARKGYYQQIDDIGNKELCTCFWTMQPVRYVAMAASVKNWDPSPVAHRLSWWKTGATTAGGLVAGYLSK